MGPFKQLFLNLIKSPKIASLDSMYTTKFACVELLNSLQNKQTVVNFQIMVTMTYTPQDILVCTLSYSVKDMQVSTVPPYIHSWAEQLDM